jgi:hypothetical protein
MNSEDLLDDAQLSLDKERLLALLLAEEGFNIPQTVVIPPRTSTGDPPLSFAQQRLWFLNQLEPDNSSYNIPAAVRMKGSLNVDALRQALNEIVQRHEALRTTFPSIDGRAVQSIASKLELPFPIITVLGEEQIMSLATTEAKRPFDLSNGPLLRASLLRLDATEHVLLLTMHHIVSDGWSIGVLIKELVVLYQSFSAGLRSPLPPLSIQYADFAVWQREWMNGEVRRKQLAYWKERLSGDLPRLELPCDHPRPPIQTFSGATQTLMVSKDLLEALKRLSREEDATLFMTLLAAFVLLLHRYSGQDDIIVGTPTANRTASEIEGLIGFFVNTLALRVRVSEEESFRELLRRVRETTIGANAHQEFPFEQLVEELQPERDMSRSPLFQVMLALQNSPMPEMELPHLNLSALHIENETALFDLLLSLAETDQGLAGKLFYNTDIFKAETITQLLAHFRELLESIVSQPHKPLATLLAQIPPQKLKLVVASTFNGTPLEESLSFWLEEFRIPTQIQFAPYSQVIEQLLDPESLLNQNKEGINLILIRLEDLNPTEFLAALKSYAQRNSTLTIIALCPPSEETLLIQRLEAMIVEQASLLTEVSVLQCGSNGTRQINDASAYNLGHIPYTPEFFTELGTVIARKIFSASLSSYKVIVLDCDETLWGGDCGKDGPDGVRIGFPYQALQELMVQQQASGMLLCLCSKNNEADVVEVFRCHPDMPLKLEHFTFCRLGGESTTENLKYLAQELRLSSERFIYLSRNPVECEQVHTLCPEVLSLCLPSDPSEIPSFLNHLWVFPHSSKSADIFVTV